MINTPKNTSEVAALIIKAINEIELNLKMNGNYKFNGNISGLIFDIILMWEEVLEQETTLYGEKGED